MCKHQHHLYHSFSTDLAENGSANLPTCWLYLFLFSYKTSNCFLNCKAFCITPVDLAEQLAMIMGECGSLPG